MTVVTENRCVECNAPLTKNYDHVGDCGGSCPGTFAHPITRRESWASQKCSRRLKGVPHRLTKMINL